MNVRAGLISLAAGLLAAGLLGGCSGSSRLDSVDAGRTIHYEPGVPNFDLEAVATVRGGQGGIDLFLSIPHASLVFLPEADGYQARFETLVRVLDRKGKRLVAEYLDADTVWVPGYEATQGFTPFVKTRRLEADPGTYLLDVVLTDAESGREARRRQRIEVVAVGQAQPVLSRIRLEGKRAGAAFEPVLSLHLPAGLDSLRMVASLYNAQALRNVEVAMRLMRFPSDTAAARPPHLFTIQESFGLVRYNRADTLHSASTPLQAPDREAAVEFLLPPLETGLYRVEVQVRRLVDGVLVAEATAPESRLVQRRDFTVRNPTYPQITTLDAMVEALVYIARKQEMAHIQAAETPEEMKNRFDAFWGALIPEQTRAANLLKRYYSRVEEANLLYSTYKEGWKTDRGMIYILFGSPIYVDTELEKEVWRYSYDDRDLIEAFVFSRRRLYGSGGLFEAFLLDRESFYEAAWRRALQRWRRGEVL